MATKGNQIVIDCPRDLARSADQTRCGNPCSTWRATPISSPEGKSLSRHQAQQNGRDWITFAVTDTNVLAAAEQIGCSGFSQASSAGEQMQRHWPRYRHQPAFCQMMGGDITVESRPARLNLHDPVAEDCRSAQGSGVIRDACLWHLAAVRPSALAALRLMTSSNLVSTRSASIPPIEVPIVVTSGQAFIEKEPGLSFTPPDHGSADKLLSTAGPSHWRLFGRRPSQGLSISPQNRMASSRAVAPSSM